MSIFPRPVRPSRALGDLWQFVRARPRHEFVFGVLATAMTGLWFWAIFDKLYPVPDYRPPPVYYATQWPASRTVAEVKAQQAKDLPAELKAKREAEAAAAAKRAQYQRMAKTLGID